MWFEKSHRNKLEFSRHRGLFKHIRNLHDFILCTNNVKAVIRFFGRQSLQYFSECCSALDLWNWGIRNGETVSISWEASVTYDCILQSNLIDAWWEVNTPEHWKQEANGFYSVWKKMALPFGTIERKVNKANALMERCWMCARALLATWCRGTTVGRQGQ